MSETQTDETTAEDGPKNDAEFSQELAAGIKEGEFTDDDTPSTLLNPYVSPEEQDMDMEPVIVGPPSYASPDPTTNAGRLRAIEDHPLQEDISEDFGADVKASEEGEEGEEENSYDGMTKVELSELASDREIEGHSSMNKDELISALRESDKG